MEVQILHSLGTLPPPALGTGPIGSTPGHGTPLEIMWMLNTWYLKKFFSQMRPSKIPQETYMYHQTSSISLIESKNLNVFYLVLQLHLSHSAASSNELLDLHTTQTQASKVRWGARFSGHQHVCISFPWEHIKRATKENLKWKKFPT